MSKMVVDICGEMYLNVAFAVDIMVMAAVDRYKCQNLLYCKIISKLALL